MSKEKMENSQTDDLKYFDHIMEKINNKSYFKLTMPSLDEYIVLFSGYGECYYEDEDGNEWEPFGVDFRIISILKDTTNEYKKYDIIEVHIYNKIKSLEHIDILDYIEEGRLRDRFSALRTAGLDIEGNISNESFSTNDSSIPEATFDSKTGIPIIRNKVKGLPLKLTPYNKINDDCDKANSYLHFYKYDEIFDGKYGIWNTIKYNLHNKLGFSLSRIDGFSGIITPDYSVYCDMPLAVQLHNIYRSRAVGSYLEKKGYYVIPNVRWGRIETYEVAFSGLDECEVIAISSFGCSKKKEDKEIFINGLRSLLYSHQFKMIIIYGSITEEMKEILEKNNASYHLYTSEASDAYRS